MWPEAGLDVPANLEVELGYFNLPKKMEDAGPEIAPWKDEALKEADAVAEMVIRRLRKFEFWPMAEKPPKYSDDFAAICLDHVQGRRFLTNGIEGEGQ